MGRVVVLGRVIMVVLLIGLSVVAAAVNSGTGVFGWAVANAVASVWANGVMANFRHNPQAAPNWAASVSILSTVIGVILLIVGLAN